MNHFVIKLADVNISVYSLYRDVIEYCKDYYSDQKPDFGIISKKEDILYEREILEQTVLREGRKRRNYSDAYLEELSIYRKIAQEMVKYDTLLFHGSAVAMDGEGYIFTAPSGTGKSTHTRLWKETYGEKVRYINDDKPLIKLAAGGPIVYGTPWDGKHRLSSNIQVPLKAICVLSRSEKNHIVPISPSEALPVLFQQTYRDFETDILRQTIPMIDRLSKSVKLYHLHCNMQREAALVACEGMRGN